MSVDRNTRVVIEARKEVRAAVWDKCGGACHYCGKAMNPFLDFSIDHIVPLREGGADTLENYAGCCRGCNSIKGARQEMPCDVEAEYRRTESHRENLAQSIALMSIRNHLPGSQRDAIAVAETIGVDVFQLTPGGLYRIWRADTDRLLERMRQRNRAPGPIPRKETSA